MPRPTHDQLIRDLGNDLAVVKAQLAPLARDIDGLHDLKVRVALLEQRVIHLEEGTQRWAQRLWMLLAPLVAGLVACC